MTEGKKPPSRKKSRSPARTDASVPAAEPMPEYSAARRFEKEHHPYRIRPGLRPERYFDLFQQAPVGFLALSADGSILEANQAGAELLGSAWAGLVHRQFSCFVTADALPRFRALVKQTLSSDRCRTADLKLRRKDGTLCEVIMVCATCSAWTDGGQNVLAVLVDIGGQPWEDTLGRTDQDALLVRLADRTAALERANAELMRVIDMNHRMQKELQDRSGELAEANATLKVLMRQRETEREEFKEKIVRSVNELIRPFLNKLATRKLGAKESRLLAVVQKNLDDLVSPLPNRLITELGRLSPTETQVLNLVRQGKTSKDIAELLGVAQSTIDFHRHNIRRKLRLSNKSINLRSYLNTIE